MLLRFIFILFALVGLSTTNAQLSWKEAPLSRTFYSGIPMAVADINGDLWDDLVILDNTKHLYIGLSLGNGEFFWKELNYHSYFSVWSVNIADIDNNGLNDILLSGESTNVHIFYQFSSGFTSEIIDNEYFLSQGASVADINQDGWLDFTLCDDNNAPRVYVNDKLGKLTFNTSLINLSIPDPRFDEGNYGSIWIDFDWDNDLDLYISKCRSSATQPTDLRRVNRLYVNENGKWSEKGAAYGVNSGEQSWCAVSEDFDNDGLFDLFVINHYDPCIMYKQKPDHSFIKSNAGIDYDGGGIQAIPFDFDNDGDVDLIIAGTISAYYRNDGNMKFTKISLPIFETGFSSCAAGDINQDGFIDLYTSYSRLFNSPLQFPDRLWLNEGNDNHAVRFNLSGTISNRNGINTKVKLYSQGKLQVRELHGGDAFGINNSLQIHFGLGAATKIDSVIFYWTSGQIDRHINLAADKLYQVLEGDCIFSNNNPTTRLTFCDKVNTTLNSNPDLNSVVWNNGLSSKSIEINEEGIYYYSGIDPNNCRFISNPFIVRNNSKTHLPLNYKFDQHACHGESFTLKSNFFSALEWSDGTTANTLEISKTGAYFAKIKDTCSYSYSDTILFTFYQPTVGNVKPDTIFKPGTLVLTSETENTNWYETASGQNVIYTGKQFITDTIKTNRSYWARAFGEYRTPSLRGGPLKPDFITGPYHTSGLNVSTYFYVYEPIILDSVTVYTDDEGERKIILKNSLDSILFSTVVDLKKGANRILLSYPIQPDAFYYSLSTDVTTNQKTFGINSPQLYHSDRNFYYPFFIENKIKIITSDIGDRRFYYFYDWAIRNQNVYCEGELIEFPIVLMPVSTQNTEYNFDAWYDIIHQEFIINDLGTEAHMFSINNIGGVLCEKRLIHSHQNMRVSLNNYPQGVYLVSLENIKSKQIHVFKCIVL